MFYPVQNFITAVYAACCFSSRTKAAQTNANTFCCLLGPSVRVARRGPKGQHELADALKEVPG